MRRLGRVREHLAAATASAVPEEAELGSEVVKVAGGEVHASSGRIGRLRSSSGLSDDEMRENYDRDVSFPLHPSPLQVGLIPLPADAEVLRSQQR